MLRNALTLAESGKYVAATTYPPANTWHRTRQCRLHLQQLTMHLPSRPTMDRFWIRVQNKVISAKEECIAHLALLNYIVRICTRKACCLEQIHYFCLSAAHIKESSMKLFVH